ncbi:hypothetical protein [Halobacillus sp. A5]|uniref:hypothetical protein n=1 Tax=Halobacillus sp. A5 TaxID=2880263 RepID=UPI0020A6A64B|nr:hypothetical protein [Halobacillus sp. A5]MCP3026880.1 hypothetical protein [Halobacillus sp. A5]
MDLKNRLISHGYDQIDILLIDEDNNQETVADITLHKVTDLEYKLYLEPDTLSYELQEDNPYFVAQQKQGSSDSKQVKGFVLEW